MVKFDDKTGKQFGRLTAVSYTKVKKSYGYRTKWLCKCSCGNYKEVVSGNLASGKVISCGCKKKENAAKLKISNTKYPDHVKSEVGVWRGIKQRCNNPNSSDYKHYGGKGISICKEWNEDFWAFYKEVGARPSKNHSIDRINNNKNYEPGNVRWADKYTQAVNKADSDYSLTKQAVARNIQKTKYNKYKVLITRHCKKHYIGTYSSLEEAITHRDNWIKNYEQQQQSNAKTSSC